MPTGTRLPGCELRGWSSCLVLWTSCLGASPAKAVSISLAPRKKYVHPVLRSRQHEAHTESKKLSPSVSSHSSWQPEESPIWMEPPANLLFPSASGRAGCQDCVSGLGSGPGFQSWSRCQGRWVPGTPAHLLLIFLPAALGFPDKLLSVGDCRACLL